MLTVLSDGDGKYRLEDPNGTLVSWINGRTITLRGFATERAAREAAVDGWRALGETLRREYAGWPEQPLATERLRIVHDGAYEWFYDGTTAIARVLRPSRNAVDGTLGIQFVLPSYAMDATVITAAHNTAAAVAPHRPALVGVVAPRGDDAGVSSDRRARLAATPKLTVTGGGTSPARRRFRPSPDGGDAA